MQAGVCNKPVQKKKNCQLYLDSIVCPEVKKQTVIHLLYSTIQKLTHRPSKPLIFKTIFRAQVETLVPYEEPYCLLLNTDAPMV